MKARFTDEQIVAALRGCAPHFALGFTIGPFDWLMIVTCRGLFGSSPETIGVPRFGE